MQDNQQKVIDMTKQPSGLVHGKLTRLARMTNENFDNPFTKKKDTRTWFTYHQIRKVVWRAMQPTTEKLF